MALPTGSYTYQAIGLGADGATTYAVEYVWSEYLGSQTNVFTSGGPWFSPSVTITGPQHTVSRALHDFAQETNSVTDGAVRL